MKAVARTTQTQRVEGKGAGSGMYGKRWLLRRRKCMHGSAKTSLKAEIPIMRSECRNTGIMVHCVRPPLSKMHHLGGGLQRPCPHDGDRCKSRKEMREETEETAAMEVANNNNNDVVKCVCHEEHSRKRRLSVQHRPWFHPGLRCVVLMTLHTGSY